MVFLFAANMSAMSSINPDEYRSPITIFASGNLCLPYLSLPYMDLLSDPSVLSYVIGTSNVLFQQKRNLADIQVDVENCTIEANDPDLRKQLSLTTEDLRFMEYLMRHVQNPKEDAQGSEFWIREQFQGYMLSLLRTAVMQGKKGNSFLLKMYQIYKSCWFSLVFQFQIAQKIVIISIVIICQPSKEHNVFKSGTMFDQTQVSSKIYLLVTYLQGRFLTMI